MREKYQNPKTVGASIYGSQNSKQGRDKSAPLQENEKGVFLVDLYDLLAMTVDLLKAHKKLDLAVDKLYRAEKIFVINLFDPLTNLFPKKNLSSILYLDFF